jgi:hypothetical protein
MKYKIRIAKSRSITIYYEENKSTNIGVYYMVECKQIWFYSTLVEEKVSSLPERRQVNLPVVFGG